MPRQHKGSVEWLRPNTAKGETAGHFRVRITCPADRSRPYIDLDPGPRSPNAEKRAREKALEWSERAKREKLTAKDFGLVRKCDASTTTDASQKAWVATWLASRAAKGMITKDNDAHWRVHIEPVLGHKHIKDWTRDDMRALSRALDEKVQRAGSDDPSVRRTAIDWKTAQNIWAAATKMCADACESKLDELRCREVNPAEGVEGPDRGAAKSKQYLYPSEFLRFVSCERVPLQWRLMVALMVFLYCRPGELEALLWEDVDLEHGTVHIHRATDHRKKNGAAKATKTGHPRRVPIEPALLPLLRAMHDWSGGEGKVIAMPSDRDLARGFRHWLRKAKVDRTELHKSTPTRKAIRFYDLRATGITWCAVRGDEPLRIMHRAGHESFQTTMQYVREAENLQAGFGTVFPPLPDSLLQPAADDSTREAPDETSEVRRTPVVAAESAEREGFEPSTGF